MWHRFNEKHQVADIPNESTVSSKQQVSKASHHFQYTTSERSQISAATTGTDGGGVPHRRQSMLIRHTLELRPPLTEIFSIETIKEPRLAIPTHPE